MAVLVSSGTRKCNIETSLYELYLSRVLEGKRTNNVWSLGIFRRSMRSIGRGDGGGSLIFGSFELFMSDWTGRLAALTTNFRIIQDNISILMAVNWMSRKRKPLAATVPPAGPGRAILIVWRTLDHKSWIYGSSRMYWMTDGSQHQAIYIYVYIDNSIHSTQMTWKTCKHRYIHLHLQK